MLDWNDLRYFLAVADEGSTLRPDGRCASARPPSPAALLRLKKRLACNYLRSARQDIPAPAGEELVDRARMVETATEGFAEASSALARDTSGVVRITTQEIFANTLLGPILRELHELHPEVVIEIDTQQELLDLGAGEADISLRSTAGEAPAGVVGEASALMIGRSIAAGNMPTATGSAHPRRVETALHHWRWRRQAMAAFRNGCDPSALRAK